MHKQNQNICFYLPTNKRVANTHSTLMSAVVCFFASFIEVILITSWPLSKNPYGNDQLLIGVISLFISIPSSMYAFFVAYATGRDTGSTVWAYSVTARKVLISSVLLSRPISMFMLISFFLCAMAVFACRGQPLQPLQSLRNIISIICDSSVVGVAIFTELTPIAIFFVFAQVYPFQKEEAKDRLTTAVIFCLYCFSLT